MSEEIKAPLFIKEGIIQELRIARGVVKLIADIQHPGLWAGVAAGMAGEASMLADSVSHAMHEGDDVEHIAMLIDGQLAVGTFEWLRDLRAGDDVKLVVSSTDDGLWFVHAILRKDDNILWLPYSVDHTRCGWVFHAIKLGGLILSLSFLMFGSFYIFDKESRPTGPWLLFIIVLSFAMVTFSVFMAAVGVISLGEYAESIFEALGVPKYKRFRIKPYSLSKLRSKEDSNAYKKGHIFDFATALAAHTKKFKLSAL
jgi:hypothetical protein